MSDSHKGQIPWNKGIPASEEYKIKLSSAHIGIQAGDKHPNWKGGITTLYDSIRKCIKMKVWIHTFFQRDNYICQDCGKRGGKLHVHHIKSFSNIITSNKITSIEEAINCSELWNINNGITLDDDCHYKRHRFGRYKNDENINNMPVL